MKKNLYTLILSCTALICLSGNSQANSRLIVDAAEEYGFSDENRLGGDELSGLRGGLRVGTLNFDFAITTKTIVDGVLQHTATLTSTIIANNQASAILAHNQAKKDSSDVNSGVNNAINNSTDNIGKNLVTNVVAETTDDITSNDINDVANNEVPSNEVPVVNALSQPNNMPTGVDVTINNDTLITTIQNNNDNAVIQQLNQMDLVVSNLSELQKSSIAQQIDFQAIQVIR